MHNKMQKLMQKRMQKKVKLNNTKALSLRKHKTEDRIYNL